MENLENALNNIRNSSNQLPNLILHSQSAGTGKTTSALAICNELGYEALIINGSSDGRLIDTLRTTVTDYCLRPDLFGGNTKRAVIFDEADMMPKDTVQSALRTMTEQFSDRNNILFIMTCNNINNIITHYYHEVLPLILQFIALNMEKLQIYLQNECNIYLNKKK